MSALYGILVIVLLSSFNCLFRYKCVSDALHDFNENSSVVSGYMTSSNYEVSYLKIFLYTLLLSAVFFVILYLLSKKSDEEIVIKKEYIIGIITSSILLYFNVIIGFVFLICTFLLFIFNLYNSLNKKKIFLIILILTILYLLLFYFVSF